MTHSQVDIAVSLNICVITSSGLMHSKKIEHKVQNAILVSFRGSFERGGR